MNVYIDSEVSAAWLCVCVCVRERERERERARERESERERERARVCGPSSQRWVRCDGNRTITVCKWVSVKRAYDGDGGMSKRVCEHRVRHD